MIPGTATKPLQTLQRMSRFLRSGGYALSRHDFPALTPFWVGSRYDDVMTGTDAVGAACLAFVDACRTDRR
jgi:hypothetical protein